MAKVRVVKNNLDENLNGGNFNNTTSQSIFSFGNFDVTSNFEGRTLIDYSKELSTFVRPVTLESLSLTDVESEQILDKTQNAVLNLDKSDLNTFVKFGSAYEFLRVSIQNIIVNYPGSLFVNSLVGSSQNITFYDFNYDAIKNVSKFKVPSQFTENNFGIIFNIGNTTIPDDNELKNLNLSYNKYVVWSTENADDNSHVILGFTGDTNSKAYLDVECVGNPFPTLSTTATTGNFDIHIKPNTVIFDDFRLSLSDYEKNIVSNRVNDRGFNFVMKDPTLLDDGTINYSDRNILWGTSDGYNIDINGSTYTRFLDVVLSIGNKFDQIKTDLVARFLSPESIMTYDLTDEKKTSKLLRLYGAEFDQMKTFIDSLVHINKVTYDKKKNLPDQIVGNLARTFGWEYFQLVKEDELVDKVLELSEPERNLDSDLTPAEVDIEMWRRILLNTNYFWKSKGTREAIKAMFLLIGIPEPFINITEYVYTVKGQIDPRNVDLTLEDLPSASLPYDSEGYPIAPIETPDFYFQASGDSDSGQHYMNNFRSVGFDLGIQVDNKKSWLEDGATYRRHSSSPTYYQQDSKLVLNTKEIDVALDTSRGIEYDVWKYTKDIDYPANSTGYTLPIAFVNLSLDVPINTTTGTQQFELPDLPSGDIEVRYNGLLLNGPQYTYSGSSGLETITGLPPAYGNPSDPNFQSGHTDYYFIDDFGQPSLTPTDKFVIGQSARNDGQGNRDVIEATYLYKQGDALAQVTVRYIVTRIAANLLNATIPLPESPNGDVQLTINGVAATKGSGQFIADYMVDGDNIIIQNPTLLSYFSTRPYVQVAYITVSGSDDINAREEQNRVDSLCGGKVYFNNNSNRAVYRLNYKINNINGVKVLVDGIALEPNVDYQVNPSNPYEVLLPPGINLGSVISAYYVVGESAAFDPIIGGDFGLGDISKLSFLEFIELVQRRLINASNRKVITDHKGGWYPTLLKVYNTYLSRSNFEDQNPLKSNGYTFENLYPFLNKYNAFFQRFVDKLLGATVIQRKGGLLIRNTVFTKQKFTYKRGVSFDPALNYFGDDGSVFVKRPQSHGIGFDEGDVKIFDNSGEFIVDGVEVDYPTTGTTTNITTTLPYNTVMYMDNVSTVKIPYTLAGKYGYELTDKLNLRLDPNILPGYDVQIELDFEVSFVNEYIFGAELVAELEVRSGNVILYNQSTNLNTQSLTPTIRNFMYDGYFNNTQPDLDVTLYSLVAASDQAQSQDMDVIITVRPRIISVSPSGTVGAIVPTTFTGELLNN